MITTDAAGREAEVHSPRSRPATRIFLILGGVVLFLAAGFAYLKFGPGAAVQPPETAAAPRAIQIDVLNGCGVKGAA
jgi:hypothetical protein